MVARKTKAEAKVHKEIMKKEWNMSKCTPLSLERLVWIGLLHAQELAGWHAPDLEPFSDPKGGEIVVLKNTSLMDLVFLYIHSCKGSAIITKSVSAICIRILCCLLLASSISMKHTVVSNPTSTIFITCFG
jgi:hypothetical protein